MHLALRMPAARQKVRLAMDKAKLDIENRLVPKGAEVARHLTLPAEGQSPQWILAEMEKMDGELGAHASWRHGKLSGAVYRVLNPSSSCLYTSLTRILWTRWRSRPRKSNCFGLSALLCLQPIAPGYIPSSSQNGGRDSLHVSENVQ
jgi:hypothetical protein